MKKTLLVIGLTLFLIAPIPLTWADPPRMSGPFVIRSSGGDCGFDPFSDDCTYAFFWVSRGQFVVIGADLGEFCGGLIAFDDLVAMDVFLPEQDSERIIDLFTMNDARATVYPLVGNPSNLCEAFDNTQGVVVATGTVDVHGQDNDFFGVGRQTNSWGWQAIGLLAEPSGNPAIFHGKQRCHFGRNGGSCSATFGLGIHGGGQNAPSERPTDGVFRSKSNPRRK